MNQLYTTWGETIDPNNVLKEYPRPQMVRSSYLNLNGFWKYAISENENIDSYDGDILVPFSPESVLSGVNRVVNPSEYLFYKKDVVLEEGFLKDRLILHFTAVDQIAEVWINDVYAWKHIGGFTPFSLDITKFLNGNNFTIKLRVKDLANTSYHQNGKQRVNSGEIFYSMQSGIWQTVWLESVNETHIESLYITPLYDQKKIKFGLIKKGDISKEVVVKVFFNGVEEASLITKKAIFELELKNLYPWIPEEPNLYDIELVYGEDIIKSYIGMRKFERKLDGKGIMRFYLNNSPYFQNGVLDQGYYPDGLLTAPSDNALVYDILLMKNLGFNMLRKHIKIEPLRWYYHCDKLGILVWQDMINGGDRENVIRHHLLAELGIHPKDNRYKNTGRSSKIGRDQFKVELVEMINHLKSITSICTWVPFNESWGQFDALEIEKLVRSLDDSRLIDHASGWFDQGGGDYHSRHIYFRKISFRKSSTKKRILALTEYGGYSLAIDNHRFNQETVFGYRVYKTKEDLEEALVKLNKIVSLEVLKGLSVLVYTQVSDVEEEVNGFVTYDRRVVKVSVELIKKLNLELKESFSKSFLN